MSEKESEDYKRRKYLQKLLFEAYFARKKVEFTKEGWGKWCLMGLDDIERYPCYHGLFKFRIDGKLI
jgi:hypothetical protein